MTGVLVTLRGLHPGVYMGMGAGYHFGTLWRTLTHMGVPAHPYHSFGIVPQFRDFKNIPTPESEL